MNQLESSSAAPKSATQTKAFSLVSADVEAIENVRKEERLMSDSAALRLLIEEGRKYRTLRQQAEKELMAKLIPSGNDKSQSAKE